MYYLVPQPAYFFPRVRVINGVHEDESIRCGDGEGPHSRELVSPGRVQDVEGERSATLQLVLATVQLFYGLPVAWQEPVIQELRDDARLAHPRGPASRS